MDLAKVKRAFQRNRYQCRVFETKEEAAVYLDREIDGMTVGFGDSLTLQTMGMYEKLSTHNTVWDVHQIDREKNGFAKSNAAFLDMARKAMTADVFLLSVNGATETGVMVNLDGTGNRVSGSLFGHRKVYFVFGVNKIAPTLGEAISRARNVAAPKNVARIITFAAVVRMAVIAVMTAERQTASAMCWLCITRRCEMWRWRSSSLMRSWGIEYLPMLQAIKKAPLAGAFLMACFLL